jgi:hypothetical protein
VASPFALAVAPVAMARPGPLLLCLFIPCSSVIYVVHLTPQPLSLGLTERFHLAPSVQQSPLAPEAGRRAELARPTAGCMWILCSSSSHVRCMLGISATAWAFLLKAARGLGYFLLLGGLSNCFASCRDRHSLRWCSPPACSLQIAQLQAPSPATGCPRRGRAEVPRVHLAC